MQVRQGNRGQCNRDVSCSSMASRDVVIRVGVTFRFSFIYETISVKYSSIISIRTELSIS
jgi:hypothetical protein